MDNRSTIPRNQTSLNYQLVWFSITYMILGSLAIVILLIPFDFMEGGFLLWALIIVGLALIFYVLSIWVLKRTWYSTKYFLAKDCLIISRGFKSTKEDIFRYDTISTVSVKQKPLEKQRGYGKIIVNVPDQTIPVILKDVNDPSSIASDLQNRIVKSTRLNYSV